MLPYGVIKNVFLCLREQRNGFDKQEVSESHTPIAKDSDRWLIIIYLGVGAYSLK